ncbi:MAG: GNAT family N-acetyltransferase [Anaerolineales bacterium]
MESIREGGMHNISVREADFDDAPAVVARIREMAQEDGASTPITEAYAENCRMYPGSGILLAEAEGRCVGLLHYSLRANLYHASPACLIELLYVKRGERGRGAGGALVDAVTAKAEAFGCAEISVSVTPDNAGAVRFHRRYGLTEEAWLPERRFLRTQEGAS